MPWRVIKHFDYRFLRIAFRKVLLQLLEKQIGPSFRKIKNEMYQKHADGFYVRAKPNLCTPSVTIKYISRYLGRPVIATSRIDNYDGDCVTFHYTRHEDNLLVTECIPAFDFIKRLTMHIPQKHFNPGTNGHIGLENVNNRIKLHYGDQYGIDVCSELNVGTTFTIKLPLLKKERSNNV